MGVLQQVHTPTLRPHNVLDNDSLILGRRKKYILLHNMQNFEVLLSSHLALPNEVLGLRTVIIIKIST